MITKEMTIGDLVRQFPQKAEILMQFGMMCVGCPSAQGESIEEAAMVHGMDLQKLLDALNA